MPPKKGKKKDTIIDGVDTSQLTREQLEVFAIKLKEENEREREERNVFQIERDKLRMLWEITRTELEESKSKLRNKDRQIEAEAEKNDDELKFYKQKVKHIQYEQQHDLTEAKTEGLIALKTAQDEHLQQERELLRDKRLLKGDCQKNEDNFRENVKLIKMDYSEKLSVARNDYERHIQEIDLKYEKAFIKLKSEMGVKHRMEVSEVEERKNNHINELTSNHEKGFTEMKNYYNDITLNNLALISSLKDQMENLRKQNERMSKQVADLTAENKRLNEPLKKALHDVQEYKRMLQNYEKDKISLVNTKTKYDETKQELADLKWVNEALELRLEKMQLEKEKLKETLLQAVLELQQRTGVKNVLLQGRIDVLKRQIEQQQLLLSNCICGVPEEQENKKLVQLFAKKDAVIQDLKYQVAKITKAHDDLLDTYEDKLYSYGIPKEELGHIPVRFVAKNQAALSKIPAGLVTKNK